VYSTTKAQSTAPKAGKPGSRLPRLLRRQRNSAGAGSILQSSAPAAFTP